MTDSKKKTMNITIPESLLAGVYANIASITVAKNEVVFDFAFLPPQAEGAHLTSRVVVSPEVARNFISAAQNALLDFEKGTHAQ